MGGEWSRNLYTSYAWRELMPNLLEILPLIQYCRELSITSERRRKRIHEPYPKSCNPYRTYTMLKMRHELASCKFKKPPRIDCQACHSHEGIVWNSIWRSMYINMTIPKTFPNSWGRNVWLPTIIKILKAFPLVLFFFVMKEMIVFFHYLYLIVQNPFEHLHWPCSPLNSYFSKGHDKNPIFQIVLLLRKFWSKKGCRFHWAFPFYWVGRLWARNHQLSKPFLFLLFLIFVVLATRPKILFDYWKRLQVHKHNSFHFVLRGYR